MRNVCNGKTQIESVENKDINVLRNIKKWCLIIHLVILVM